VTQTEACTQMLRWLLQEEFPRLVEHTVVLVEVGADYLFRVEPGTSKVWVRFSPVATRSASLMDLVREAGTSAEQVLHGRSTAARHQLDAIDWWIWQQRQLPCTD
jgi:hypothetical protein